MASETTNVQAFLRLIRFAEHNKDSDNTYFHIYGAGSCGPGVFSDTSKHPNIMVSCWGNKSTAAGAYQILYGTWAEARQKGIAPDFTAESQDKIAIWKLKTRKAYQHVAAGNIEQAIPLLRNEWTSLPGAKQSKMTMETAKQKFAEFQNLVGP